MEAVEKHPGRWKEGESQAGREGTPPRQCEADAGGSPGPQTPAPTLLAVSSCELYLWDPHFSVSEEGNSNRSPRQACVNEMS